MQYWEQYCNGLRPVKAFSPILKQFVGIFQYLKAFSAILKQFVGVFQYRTKIDNDKS